MEVKTFRAASMQEALRLVRNELGPDAAVLESRRLGRLQSWFGGAKIEVTASGEVSVPSRFTSDVSINLTHEPPVELPPPSISESPSSRASQFPPEHPPATGVPPIDGQSYRAEYREHLHQTWSEEENSLVHQFSQENQNVSRESISDSLFQLFTELLDADLSEEQARQLIRPVQGSPGDNDLMATKARIARSVEEMIQVAGPIESPPGACRVVALVGPTGVGKTTTIAKLAANYRLREKRRVGLVTVDTYRIAAVEQLRTYADIIDLPMEVVSTPRQMREAIARLSHLDLILLDTAGRSPRDDVQIQELKSILGEANADEVHLVLSTVASANTLTKTAQRFREVGANALLLTKIDEATGLGNLLGLIQSCGLPISYLTHGQNVPDDITVAKTRSLAHAILGFETT